MTDEPQIIFQDIHLLVLDKPTEWVVNDADTTKHLKTVQGWLEKNFKYPISKSKELRSGIVHRLDKPTSGVLLVAKTKDVMESLQAQFKARTVQKIYLALVHGRVVEKEGVVDVSVGRLPWNKRKFGIVPGGREAETKYTVEESYKKDDKEYTLLSCFPKTGRTHQIRIHLKHLGHPIVGDKMYAGRKTWRHDNKWCPRLFLHAREITIKHPESGKKVTFKSQIPIELRNSLEYLAQ